MSKYISLLCFVWGLGAGAIEPHAKTSLRQIVQSLKDPAAITEMYQLSLKKSQIASTKAFDKIYKKNQQPMTDFAKATLSSSPFVRGEIEDEKVLAGFMQLLQLSALKIQSEGQKKKYLRSKEEAALWLLFAADFPYEEASLVGLRLAAVVRSIILDQLENLEKKSGPEFLNDPLWLAWAKSLRSPWPIDRVVLSEGRRSLNNLQMKAAEKLAAALQKNAYQTAAQVLDQTPGGNADAMKPFRQMWRAEEVDQMKTEINRIQAMKIRWAQIQYQAKNKKPAARVEQLVQDKILDQLPIDYKTGVAMSFEQAALH